MKIARVAVLGVALGAGVLAAVLALNLTSRPTPAPQVNGAPAPTMETVDVLVARKDIVTGTRVTNDAVGWEPWPMKGVSDKFLTRTTDPQAAEKVAGAFARSTFFQGEPISEGKLIRTDQGFMSAILPEGKRAVATRIAADTSAGGFILPNDRVDVIMTRQAPTGNGGANEYITETILNNVRVLAIDQTIEEKDGEKVVVGQTATLELSPQQAQILTVAQQMSDRLTLALRSIADATDKPGNTGPDAIHLIGGTKRSGSITVVKNGVAKEVNGSK
jgi:pilus assembly protein CpaB